MPLWHKEKASAEFLLVRPSSTNIWTTPHPSSTAGVTALRELGFLLVHYFRCFDEML